MVFDLNYLHAIFFYIPQTAGGKGDIVLMSGP